MRKGASHTEVVLDLKSRILAEETDSIDINTLGDMTWKDGACHLTYETPDENGRLTRTRLIVEDGSVTVSQQGGMASLLTVREGERTLSPYETPYGSFSVGVTGHRIRSLLSPDGGSLYLEYDVDIQSSAVSKNIIEIHVRRVSDDV